MEALAYEYAEDEEGEEGRRLEAYLRRQGARG